ncbi:hypothetical protein PG988_003536 [Apiospora saccharicola]
MHELGFFVAKQVLEYERDQSKAAAILLLICLDFAYNSVVSLQKCVFSPKGQDDEGLEKMVQLMAQAQVRLPIVRKASKTDDYQFSGIKSAKPITIQEGDVVVLGLSRAIGEATTQSDAAKVEFLTSQLSIADKYGVFSYLREVRTIIAEIKGRPPKRRGKHRFIIGL